MLYVSLQLASLPVEDIAYGVLSLCLLVSP